MPAGPALDNSWGAVLIGVFLACFLYGLLTLQVYVYHEIFPKDRLWIKMVVRSVWVLDTLHTIFITYLMYTQLITNFGDYDALAHNSWAFNMNVCITTLVAAISQVFFIHRCWRFDKSLLNSVLSGIILCFAAVQFSFGMLCTHLTFQLSYYAQFLDYTWAVDTWLGSAACTDILVSFALVRLLMSQRTDIQRTKTLIEKLIRWTVTTGMITSVWALLDLILFTSSESTLIHLLFNVVLAKLYANTLLAALNHRVPSPAVTDGVPTHAVSLSQMSRSRRTVSAATHENLTTSALPMQTCSMAGIDDLEAGRDEGQGVHRVRGNGYGNSNASGYSSAEGRVDRRVTLTLEDDGGFTIGMERGTEVRIGHDTELEQSMDDRDSFGIDSPSFPARSTSSVGEIEELKVKPEEA